jgi:hypothetical protein
MDFDYSDLPDLNSGTGFCGISVVDLQKDSRLTQSVVSTDRTLPISLSKFEIILIK